MLTFNLFSSDIQNMKKNNIAWLQCQRCIRGSEIIWIILQTWKRNPLPADNAFDPFQVTTEQDLMKNRCKQLSLKDSQLCQNLICSHQDQPQIENTVCVAPKKLCYVCRRATCCSAHEGDGSSAAQSNKEKWHNVFGFLSYSCCCKHLRSLPPYSSSHCSSTTGDFPILHQHYVGLSLLLCWKNGPEQVYFPLMTECQLSDDRNR